MERKKLRETKFDGSSCAFDVQLSARKHKHKNTNDENCTAPNWRRTKRRSVFAAAHAPSARGQLGDWSAAYIAGGQLKPLNSSQVDWVLLLVLLHRPKEANRPGRALLLLLLLLLLDQFAVAWLCAGAH